MTACLYVYWLVSTYALMRAVSARLLPGLRLSALGWRDNGDAQYVSLRDGAPSLLALAAGHVTAVRLAPTGAWRDRLDLGLGIGLLVTLHGGWAGPLLGVLLAVYAASRLRLLATGALWAFVVGSLGVVYWRPAVLEALGSVSWRQTLGWMSVWRFIVLRLVSFHVDAHALTRRAGTSLGARPPYARVLHSSPAFPSVGLYLAYVLSPSLYIAGPIVNFEDYVASLRSRARRLPSLPTRYALRLLVLVGLFEAALVAYPMYTLRAHVPPTPSSPVYASVLTAQGFQALFVQLIWFKFAVMWTFFRLWALASGLVHTPENMPYYAIMCASSNQVWRIWHASFRLFNVRYLYVAVGGRHRRHVALVAVFLFVGFWHDASVRLLTWGAATAACIAAETLPALLFGPECVPSALIAEKPPPLAGHIFHVLYGGLLMLVTQSVHMWGFYDENAAYAMIDLVTREPLQLVVSSVGNRQWRYCVHACSSSSSCMHLMLFCPLCPPVSSSSSSSSSSRHPSSIVILRVSRCHSFTVIVQSFISPSRADAPSAAWLRVRLSFVAAARVATDDCASAPARRCGAWQLVGGERDDGRRSKRRQQCR